MKRVFISCLMGALKNSFAVSKAEGQMLTWPLLLMNLLRVFWDFLGRWHCKGTSSVTCKCLPPGRWGGPPTSPCWQPPVWPSDRKYLPPRRGRRAMIDIFNLAFGKKGMNEDCPLQSDGRFSFICCLVLCCWLLISSWCLMLLLIIKNEQFFSEL